MSYAVVGSKSTRFAVPEEYAGFVLCDPLEKRIGKVKRLFVNAGGEPEYISVQMGFFGLRGSANRRVAYVTRSDRKAVESL